MSYSSKAFTGFSEPDRQRGIRRTGNQCEMEVRLGVRCAEEAVECVPCLSFIIAGQPVMDYVVAVCTEHFYRHRRGLSILRAIMLVKRRVFYFPVGESTGPLIVVPACRAAERRWTQ